MFEVFYLFYQIFFKLSELPNITETYEIQWIIPEWKEIRKNEILLRNQKVIIETCGGTYFPCVTPTKWAVELVPVSHSTSQYKYGLLCWKLMEIGGNRAEQIPEATVQTELLSTFDLVKYTDVKTEKDIAVGHTIRETGYCVQVLHIHGCTSNFDYIRANASIKYALKLTLKSSLTDEEYISYKMTQFMEKSNKEMCANLATLLNDRDGSSDLKIVTSNNAEINVHRAILKAQCPVFATMLNCDLDETNTGIVKVNDVSSFSMNILLNYFYTGQLLPDWREEENIVEFTYTAGKYQVTHILGLLDDVLGRSVPEGDATHIDVQVLKLAANLPMRNAEGRLLKRIVARINNVKRSQEIYELFGYGDDEILEKAEVLGGETFGETKALEIFDDLLGNTEDNQDELEKRGLHLLSLCK